MPTEFQDTISLVSSAIQIGVTVRFPLLLWLLLLKDYNNLYTIHISLPLMKDYNNLYTIRMSLPLMKDYNNLYTIHKSMCPFSSPPTQPCDRLLYTMHKEMMTDIGWIYLSPIRTRCRCARAWARSSVSWWRRRWREWLTCEWCNGQLDDVVNYWMLFSSVSLPSIIPSW